MTRELTAHLLNGHSDELSKELRVEVLDEPGPGGANHEYRVVWLDGYKHLNKVDINFQNGAIQEIVASTGAIRGLNGVTQEVLLAIVQDRLECFQAGSFACDENQVALDHVKAALASLLSRTRARIARGVEGKNEK